ncbi:PspC domain-containing protein [Ancylomarina sp. YFZ004]
MFKSFLNLKRKIMILGVAGWLSGKLGWDVKLIRIAFVVSALFFGTGIGLYLILWLVKLLSK